MVDTAAAMRALSAAQRHAFNAHKCLREAGEHMCNNETRFAAEAAFFAFQALTSAAMQADAALLLLRASDRH